MINGLKIATGNTGIKYVGRDDLLIVSFDEKANVAGVFTQSSTAAAPVLWCRKNLKKHQAKALIVNSGNANAFTGDAGEKTVIETAKTIADILDCEKEEIYVASTGVIGEKIDNDKLCKAITKTASNFNNNENVYIDAAKSIMTTDTKPKIYKKRCKIGDVEVELIGIAKGSGMIAPNMATMLGYIFTDADISSEALQILLKDCVEKSFNSITVDSDQSTNDTVMLFATKAAKNTPINDPESKEIAEFKTKLDDICLELAKMIVIDGEGATKLIEIEVKGAMNDEQAKNVAFGVANSPLVKTAIAGEDPNWGRIVMAVGKSTTDLDQKKLIIKIGDYILTKDGEKHPYYVEEKVHQYLKQDEVKISIDLNQGKHEKLVWTCDLNDGYIKINKDYRS